MYHFQYVSKNEIASLKNQVIELIGLVQDEIRNFFTFQYEFIGSVKLNMVTCDVKSNIGFDFDVNIMVNDDAGNLIKSVWYNAIYEERNSETDQSEVTNLMKQLKEPPKKYEEAYSVLKVYYDNYLKMTKIVINPTGSLNAFSEDFNAYDNNTVDS